MAYTYESIQAIYDVLLPKAQAGDAAVLRGAELKSLYEEIKTLPPEDKANFGQQVNELKKELEALVGSGTSNTAEVLPIDITAPWGINTPEAERPQVLPAHMGTQHPLTKEIDRILDIYYRMGFTAVESKQLDDDYHMFESLNFPEGHPARDDYDTFMTDEGFIAPAHTSTMQNRVLKTFKGNLEKGEAIAVVIPGRVFRNEDLDATHEHTFHQLEGVYVQKGANVGNLIAVLKSYMSEFFGQELHVKIQPFYFPFTEPSFEFAVERPKAMRKDNSEAEQWLEIGGCGMIHPNVLTEAGIDPKVYTGFAWGFGIERMVMLRNGIEDVRHFHSAKLEFLRQFK
jgi:phenylalanyl-tRNA synthetase alpha chain